MTLFLALTGCIYYACEEPGDWEEDSGWELFDDGDGCELKVQQEGDVHTDDGEATVEFSVRIEGDDCDPGGLHEVEMEEYDDGGSLTNAGSDSWDAIRTGEEKRYTLGCEVTDDGSAGECGCVVSAAGDEKTIKIVLE